MKNRIAKIALAMTVISVGSSAMASDLLRTLHCDRSVGDAVGCVISSPTITSMVLLVAPVALSMDSKANEAVAAAQEPAYMVLNNEPGATDNPLFQNAVTILKKEVPEIKTANDEQMAALILKLGEQSFQ
ncbi:MAG: hypothetical protein ACXVCY_18540 [Pseudobdellovibrionaceae bacterium]